MPMQNAQCAPQQYVTSDGVGCFCGVPNSLADDNVSLSLQAKLRVKWKDLRGTFFSTCLFYVRTGSQAPWWNLYPDPMKSAPTNPLTSRI